MMLNLLYKYMSKIFIHLGAEEHLKVVLIMINTNHEGIKHQICKFYSVLYDMSVATADNI